MTAEIASQGTGSFTVAAGWQPLNLRSIKLAPAK
jgi:hypothetical protein